MDYEKLIENVPGAVLARYTEQRLPQFKKNPLIEALPPLMSNAEIFDSLLREPDFDASQREWSTEERLEMLPSLYNCMVPLKRHIELSLALNSLLKNGYVSRAPHTVEQAKVAQRIYELQKSGKTFSQSASSRAPQISTSMIGLSGMGKTTSVERILAHLPQVIYHPEYNLYQIPRLHVEMPSDGSSIKGLAYAILRKLDELIPTANYFDEYTAKGRTGADALMRVVARLMNIHAVGLLICDEVQNLANSHKGAQTVMTELVSACNDLKVPILFIGTNKARKVLSLDFRQSRRSSGSGIAQWSQLSLEKDEHGASEWSDFLSVVWTYQWVRRPTVLTDAMLHLMYEFSQGIIDVALKIFASAQARAILDGSEEITADLLLQVYQDDFQLLHPMLRALREDDLEALSCFDDIAPLNLQDIVESSLRKLRMGELARRTITNKSDEKTFVEKVAATLVSAGYTEKDSVDSAVEVAQSSVALSVPDAVRKVVVDTKSVRRGKSKKAVSEVTASAHTDFSDRPNDYRLAIVKSKLEQTTVFQQLKNLGHVPKIEELFDLD